MVHYNIGRQEGNRFYPASGCLVYAFFNEVIQTLRDQSFPHYTAKGVAVIDEGILEIPITAQDTTDTAMKKYRDEQTEIARAYGDDV